MTRFCVVEAPKMEGSVRWRRTLEDLIWREANTVYLSHKGRRKGMRKVEETPDLIRQDDESFVEVIGNV